MSRTDDHTSDTAPRDDDPLQAEVAAADEGDRVDLATTSYRWSNPVDIVAAEPPVEWETPFTTGWWTRRLRLETTSGKYELEYSSIPTPPRVDLYRVEDGERAEKHGEVDHFAVLDDEFVLMRGAQSTGSRGTYHLPDPDDPTQPKCRVASKNDIWYRKDPSVLDGWSVCQHCDPDPDPDDDTDTDGDERDAETDVALPEGTTPGDVEDVVDDLRAANGKAKLGDVADALGVPVARARTILVALDLYGDHVREVYRSNRGGDRRA